MKKFLNVIGSIFKIIWKIVSFLLGSKTTHELGQRFKKEIGIR